MKQGDVYWYTFRAPDKRRPVLILTRNSAIHFLTGITVAPLTTRVRNIPTEVVLTPEIDNIQTVRKECLDEYLTSLSLSRIREVFAAIEFALGFETLKQK